MNNIIFVPSVQHTGTQFVCGMLVDSYMESYKSHLIHLWMNGANTFQLTNKQNNKYVNSFAALVYEIENIAKTSDVTVIQAHLGGYEPSFVPMVFIQELMTRYPTVIPMRDPLLSLITQWVRHPEADALHNMIGFSFLCDFGGSFYLPVDLYKSKGRRERRKKLKELFEYVNISVKKEVLDYCVGWPWIGSTLTSEKSEKVKRLKKLLEYYENDNLRKIIEIIPDGYKFLKSIEYKLKPFLMQLGYTDLLWWDKKIVR